MAPEVQADVSQLLAALSAEQSAGQPPFSLVLVQHACLKGVMAAACFPTAGPPPDAAAQLHVLEVAATSQARLGRLAALDPANLNTFYMLHCNPVLMQQSSPAERISRMQLVLRGVRVAQAQRSDYWAVRLAAAAVELCSLVSADLPPATLQAVVVAAQQADAALGRCRLLLPHSWANALLSDMAMCGDVLPEVHARLASLRAQDRGDVAAAAAADRLGDETMAAIDATADQRLATLRAGRICAGCGQRAAGLCACSRCRAAFYCSLACQRQHWDTHKRDCRPPEAAS